jgi:hypothetical protein
VLAFLLGCAKMPWWSNAATLLCPYLPCPHLCAMLTLLPAVHSFDAGGPVTVVELDAASPEGCKTTLLGRDLAAGQQLQHVVAPHAWFGAAPAEGTDWALVGCTVAPGQW